MKIWLSIGGFVLGAIVGYPLSYFFQPGALRAKLSISGYIEHIGDVMDAGDQVTATAIGVWIACAVILAVVGAVLGMVADRKRE